MNHQSFQNELEFYRDLFQNSSELIHGLDEEGRFLWVNDAWKLTMGYGWSELSSLTIWDLLREDTIPQHRIRFQEVLKGAVFSKNQLILRTKSGSYLVLEGSSRSTFNEEGAFVSTQGIYRDVTMEKRMEETIYTEKELFRTTLMSVGDGIISTDEAGRILMLNPVAEQLTGWTSAEAQGRPLEEVFSVQDNEGKTVMDHPAKRVLRTGEINKLENHTVLISRQGEKISIEDVVSPVKNRNGRLTGVVLVFRDVREKMFRQQQIEFLSFHDHLTGLYNRRYMEDALKRLDTPRNLPLAIMVLDVNGLKLTNDAFGHLAGDELLVRVAQILKSVCRSDDLIGRVGGDEFLILFPNTNKESAEVIKQRINNEAEKEKIGSVIVSIAIGYAVKSDPAENVEVIQQDADNFMYQDKIKHGKSMKTGTIQSVMRDLYQRFQNEEQHINEVARICEIMGRKLNLTDQEVELLKNAAMVHDVGKIIIPEQILNKPATFTKEELELVRRHPETSYQILKSVEDFATMAEIALHHHERWDGRGYPQGLVGEDIPMMSRVLSIADAYQAMTSPRSYRGKRSREEAIQELRRCGGTQFDPDLVDVFINQVLPDVT